VKVLQQLVGVLEFVDIPPIVSKKTEREGALGPFGPSALALKLTQEQFSRERLLEAHVAAARVAGG
jgi:hypothetical protein